MPNTETTLRPKMRVPLYCRVIGEFEGYAILKSPVGQSEEDAGKRWSLWLVNIAGDREPVCRWIEDGPARIE